jgi:hypothetical protein
MENGGWMVVVIVGGVMIGILLYEEFWIRR